MIKSECINLAEIDSLKDQIANNRIIQERINKIFNDVDEIKRTLTYLIEQNQEKK